MIKIFSLILCLVSTGCLLPPPKIVSWKGKGKLGLVTFPSIWLDRPSVGMSLAEKYKIRSIIRDGKESLLFKAVSANGSVSNNQFVVSLTPSVTVESASDADWKAAKEISQFPELRLEDTKLIEASGRAGASDPPAPEYFTYNGVSYTKSGKIWGNYYGVASPAKEWLVLCSHTPEGDYRSSLVASGDQKVPHKGKTYFDIYRTRTGDSVNEPKDAHIVSTFGAAGPACYPTLWVEDRYLIIPVDIQLASCIIWEIPK